MVLTVHGHLASTYTRMVLLVLKETNTPYEFVVVKVQKDAHKTPEYLEKQPFGKIPYIEDDGLVLFESRAIARYIATKTGSPLAPTGDAHAVAHFEQAAAIEACEFTPLAQGIAVQRHFNPAFGKPCDEARVEELAGDLAAKMAGYNRLLAKSRYLAGDEVTLADLFHLAYGVHLAPHGFSFLEDEEKFPHVARWWKDLTSREAWQDVQNWRNWK